MFGATAILVTITNSSIAGGDDNVIMIWTLEQMLKMGSPGSQPAETLDEIGSVERWRIATVLRRHSEDVYDLAWSPNSTQLLSGSVDTTCVIWVGSLICVLRSPFKASN